MVVQLNCHPERGRCAAKDLGELRDGRILCATMIARLACSSTAGFPEAGAVSRMFQKEFGSANRTGSHQSEKAFSVVRPLTRL